MYILKFCFRWRLETVESGTEEDAGTGEIDEVAGRKIGSESDGDWPGTSDGKERRSLCGLHCLIVRKHEELMLLWFGASKAEWIVMKVVKQVEQSQTTNR